MSHQGKQVINNGKENPGMERTTHGVIKNGPITGSRTGGLFLRWWLILLIACFIGAWSGCGGGNSGSSGGNSSDNSSDDIPDNSFDNSSALNATAAGAYDLVFSNYSSNYTDSSMSVTTKTGSHTIKYKAYSNIVYVANPVDPEYESMNCYVPYEIDGGSISTTNAPILLNIDVGGYAASSVWGGRNVDNNGNGKYALAAGCVVVWVGCRGRDNYSSTDGFYGKAPAAIVDLKAAVRYIHYNAGTFPGNADRIISSGGSAGGALSALLGASGNSSLYDSYLQELGAADADDDIFAVGAWSPDTNLDHADMAYEWEYGSVSGSTVNQAISGELKSLFGNYQDGLFLSGKNSYGAIASSNINDYILGYYLEPSATIYLNSLSPSDRTTYLNNHTWITWDGSTATFTFSDYINYTGREKSVPAFDSFIDSSSYSNVNTSETAEIAEFGDSTTNARHFTDYSLQKTTGDSGVTIVGDLKAIVNMMNPMYFVGRQNSKCAEYWYIRQGSRDLYNSVIVMIDLATSIENFMGEDHVDAWVDWDKDHNINADPDGFITWIDAITGYSI